MSPCVWTGPLTPGPLSPCPAGQPPWITLHRGDARKTAPRVGGRGGYRTGHPHVDQPGTVRGPAPDTRPHPRPLPPCPTYGDGAYPLAPAGAPQRSGAAPAGEDRGSTRARHGGARRLFDLARPPHSCGPAPLALGRRDGDSFRRGNCDGPSHGFHTRGTRFPGNMPHYHMFQTVPLSTHL